MVDVVRLVEARVAARRATRGEWRALHAYRRAHAPGHALRYPGTLHVAAIVGTTNRLHTVVVNVMMREVMASMAPAAAELARRMRALAVAARPLSSATQRRRGATPQ